MLRCSVDVSELISGRFNESQGCSGNKPVFNLVLLTLLHSLHATIVIMSVVLFDLLIQNGSILLVRAGGPLYTPLTHKIATKEEGKNSKPRAA